MKHNHYSDINEYWNEDTNRFDRPEEIPEPIQNSKKKVKSNKELNY